MTDETIFLTDTLDTKSLNDEKYIQLFYLTLKDSEYVSLSDHIDDAKYQ
jgi:hypothetical protein